MAVTTVSLPLQNGTYTNADGFPDFINIEVSQNVYFNLGYSNGSNSAQNYSYAWLSTRNETTGEHVASPAFAINQTFNNIARGLIFKVADNKVVVIATNGVYQFYTYDVATMRVIASSAIKTNPFGTLSSSFSVDYRRNYVYQHSYARALVGYVTAASSSSQIVGLAFNAANETIVTANIGTTDGGETMYSDYGFQPIFNSNGKVMLMKPGTPYNSTNNNNNVFLVFPESGSNGSIITANNASYGGLSTTHNSTTYLATRIVNPASFNSSIVVAQNNIEWVSNDGATTLRVQVPGVTSTIVATLVTDSGNAISGIESGLTNIAHRHMVFLDENHLMQVCLGMAENNVHIGSATRTFTQKPYAMNIRFIERQTATRWVVSERTRVPLQVSIPASVMINGANTALQGFECGNCGFEFVNNEWVLRYRVGGRRHTFKIT